MSIAPTLPRVAPLYADAMPPTAETGPPAEVLRGLFEAHWVGLCRLAWLILGDHGAAEETVQEAFMKLYTGWDRLRDPERVDHYLRAVVVNGCRSKVRRRQTEHRVNRRALPLPSLSEESQGIEPDEVRRVAQAVRALPPRQRAAVVLRYYEDLSEADIAATLGCSVGTVKSQLAKARQQLGRRLVAHPEEERS